MYIAINNCDWQDAITNKCHPQPTMLVACSNFAINNCRLLRLTVNHVSVVLIILNNLDLTYSLHSSNLKANFEFNGAQNKTINAASTY